ncbi:MAG: tetratricopeptide repeat protein [Methylophaga sp.]|nr:tetratricopeptide repeat protein [Methylophaga sp.]
MKISFIKIALLSLFLLSINIVWAADSDYLLTEKTYKVLSAAQELMAADKNNAAETKLKTLLGQVKSGSYEMAVVQQTLGYLYSSQEKYKQASILFQKALDSNALPEKVSHDLNYNLGQLLLADGQYKKGIVLLEKWMSAEKSPPTNAHVLMASAYYRVKQYKGTVRHITTAIKRDKSAKEAWYQVLLSAHIELKQYKSAINVLETLITRYPYKKDYWNQLAGLYLQQNKEFSALSVKMLAQRLELGDTKTLRNLIDMYSYLRIPYKSAQMLKTGMNNGVIKTDLKNLNDLADSWLAAREEKKAAAILKRITALDNSGKADLKYGRVLFDLEQWKSASEALSKSTSKLSGDQAGQAFLLLGMTQFHLNNLPQAKKSFNKATAFSKQRSQAARWIQHIDNQLKERQVEEQQKTTEAATG